MRKLLVFLTMLFSVSPVWASEVITGFDTEKDLPVLNEELRKLEVKINQAATATTVQAATQAQIEATGSTTTYISPGRAQYHPSATKAWCVFTGTTVGTHAVTAGYNVNSVTRNGTGDYTLNWVVPFSSGNYAVIGNCGNGADPTTNLGVVTPRSSFSTSSARILTWDQSGSAVDPVYVMINAYGDQ